MQPQQGSPWLPAGERRPAHSRCKQCKKHKLDTSIKSACRAPKAAQQPYMIGKMRKVVSTGFTEP
jgi:hypothetical protein